MLPAPRETVVAREGFVVAAPRLDGVAVRPLASRFTVPVFWALLAAAREDEFLEDDLALPGAVALPLLTRSLLATGRSGR